MSHCVDLLIAIKPVNGRDPFIQIPRLEVQQITKLGPVTFERRIPRADEGESDNTRTQRILIFQFNFNKFRKTFEITFIARRMTVQVMPRTVSLTLSESKFSTMSIQVPVTPSIPDFFTISRPKRPPI